ncbi:MAG: hypothetical protein JO001_14635 [Alphaproteobacteria bacterium]|nr:hypothetical protein [Alphaproteobacteria bacterium]
MLQRWCIAAGCDTVRGALLILVLLAGGLFPAPAPAQDNPSTSPDGGIHLGVASCASSNCHGAREPLGTSSVRQDEYSIWSQETDPHRIDEHHRAYTVLLEDRALRIAHNLGLPDAASASLCLDCHADNAAADRRGPEFRLADGVGCEACHGAAEGWLGQHLTGAGHKADLAAGLYPTEQPVPRAELCLSCHLGDRKRVMTHRIMGAGHPPLPFELDTFTATEPAHYVVDKRYVGRKGTENGVQVWAAGQAISVVKRMDAILDPENTPHGLNLELVLFDCNACHHSSYEPRWRSQPAAGLGPGAIRLYDANLVMLQVIAARIAPADAASLRAHLLALHRATLEDWSAVQREAAELRATALRLVPLLAGHDFTREDIAALAAAVMTVVVNGEDVELSGAEQAAMALESIIAAMRSLGYLTNDTMTAIDNALDKVDEALAGATGYRPEPFMQAIGSLRNSIPQ